MCASFDGIKTRATARVKGSRTHPLNHPRPYMTTTISKSHNFIPQYADAFDFQFDDVAAPEPGMHFSAYFEQAAGADSAGAEYVTGAQAGITRGPGDHLWKTVIDVFEVAARDFLTIDTRQHGHIVAFARAAATTPRGEFIGRDQPGAKRGGKVFALAGSQVELHVLALEVARAPVVHDGIARDITGSFLYRDIFAVVPNHAGNFQLNI